MDKLTANNTVCYIGKVSLKMEVNGKTFNYSNNGKPELFRLFARALAGYNVSEDTPYYISGYRTDGSGNVPFIQSPIPISARNFVNDDEGGSVRFTARLSPNNLVNLASGPTYTLNLLKKDLTTELASIEIEDGSEIFSELPSSARILLEWNMSVRNGEQ